MVPGAAGRIPRAEVARYQRVFIDLWSTRRSRCRMPPPAPSPVSTLDRRHTRRLSKRDILLTGDGGGVGEGAESYDNEKAFSL
jgi:hypothetical protein